ncbi:hypothetical protein BDV12DRAFT_158175 [Aspergillus spectabilis]
MFHFNRALSAGNIDWEPRRLFFLEAWNFPNVSTATSWNFRTGFLDNLQIEEWLHQAGSFAAPIPPLDVGSAHGGIRLLACDYTLFKKVSLGISREAFDLVEARLDLHPATLPSLEVATGTFSKHVNTRSRISIILKAPQKYEIGNHMLSLAHDPSTGWTTALLAGESIVDSAGNTNDMSLPLSGPLSPCVVVRAYLTSTTALWGHPLTLPSIILTDHLKRLQRHSTGDLTRQVMYIEEQLGVTRVGRRNRQPVHRSSNGTKNNAGGPVERLQAEHLTVSINTELTRLLFTAHAPRWNYQASQFLINIVRGMDGLAIDLPPVNDEIIGLLEHNNTLARTIEDHVLGLQKRLELQLNVLYSFVAQTDNRLSARLAATAGRDSTSMKILAFITTIFLPGTYVATVFSMSMFNWEEGSTDTVGSDSNSPTISPRFWIYWAVSAPLTALTLGGWALWWSFEKHRYDEHLEDTVKRPEVNRKLSWWRKMLQKEDGVGLVKPDLPEIVTVDDRGGAQSRSAWHSGVTMDIPSRHARRKRGVHGGRPVGQPSRSRT